MTHAIMNYDWKTIELRYQSDIASDIWNKISQFGNSRKRRTENNQQNSLNEQHRISGYWA